jgi:hypothetical protein
MEANPQPNSLKCANCGLESTIPEAFIVKKRSGDRSGSPSTLCVECDKKKRSSLSPLTWVLLVLVVFLFLLYDPAQAQFFLCALAGLLLIYPLIFLHEGAHALSAHLLGFRVFGIHLGAGRVLYTTHFLGLRWYLHQIPLSGATVLAGLEMPRYHLRKFLILLAGPGIHLILVALLSWQWTAGIETSPSWLEMILQILIFINGFLLLLNLYPQKGPVAVGVTGTDGYEMLSILQGKTDPERFTVYYALEVIDAVDLDDLTAAHRWIERGLAQYPENAVLLNTQGYLLLHTQQYAQARQLFLQLSQPGQPLPETMKYAVFNNLAYANLMLEDPDLLSEADELSALAYKNNPWEAAITGTRGETLVALGQTAAGIHLLKQALTRNTERKNKAINAAFLARAELRCGRAGEAEKYLALAEKLDSKCVLLARVKQEMGKGAL